MYSLPYVVQLLMYVACKPWVERMRMYYVDLVMEVMNIMTTMLCIRHVVVGGDAALAASDDDNETLLTKTELYYSIHPQVSLDH